MQMTLYYYVLLVLVCEKMTEVCEKYVKLHDVLFNGSKNKLLVYNKKDADPHCEINGTDVSTCEKTIHLGNVLSTTNKYEMVFDDIKTFNCNVNRFMSEFGSIQTVVKNKLFHQYCCAWCGSQLWPLWHDIVNKMSIQWRNALRKVWKLPYGSHTDLVPLTAECVPLDVALVFRFIKFYRTVALSDNMVANTMTFAYRSTVGQNVRHIMSKNNMTYHELLYMPMSVVKHKCREMWNININATYYDNSKMICEVVEMKDCNNDAVLNKEECNAVISYLSTI